MSRYKAVLVRNFTLFYRSWIKFLIEVITVFSVFIILIYNPLQEKVNHLPNPHYRTSDPVDLNNQKPATISPTNVAFTKLGYSPPGGAVDNIANTAAEKLGLTAQSFENKEVMEQNFFSEKLFAAVEFANVEEIEKKLFITIRFPAKLRFLDKDDVNELHELYWVTINTGVLEKDENLQTAAPDSYIKEGFVHVQQAIFTSWAQIFGLLAQTQNFVPRNDNFRLRSYEYYHCPLFKPLFIYDFLTYFCFFPSYCIMLWRFGREIEKNMPFHHWKMGCSFFFYWITNYIMTFIYLFVLDILIFLIIKIKWTRHIEVFQYANYADILWFFFTYNTAIIFLTILIGTIMQNAKDAVLLGSAWWLCNYGLFGVYLYSEKEEPSGFIYFAIVLFPNNNIIPALHLLRYHPYARHTFHVYNAMVIGNIFLTFAIFLLIRPVRPGRFLYSTSLKRAYCPCVQYEGNKGEHAIYNVHDIDWNRFEFGPPNKELAVKLRNVTTFRGSSSEKYFPGLKNVTMRVFIGEITVIVGSKQAGKTTLARVLSGWQTPDIGIVYYWDTDIHAEWKKVSKTSDVLFIYNPLYDLLSVNESLLYIIRIKCGGNDPDVLRKEREKWEYYIESFITDDSILVNKLDHDKKRLLCLCCSLACGQKLVIMDEPTVNLSFRNQRIFWEILRNEKENRAIVLTSQNYVEANMIGDRIGFLENGELMAMGTPFFLKTAFGTFDNMIIYKTADANVDELTAFLQKYVTNIVPENNLGEQVIYQIPYQYRSSYQRLLLVLEKQSQHLGVTKVKIVSPELKDIYQSLSYDQSYIRYQPLVDQICAEIKPVFVPHRKICCSQMKAIAFKKIMETSSFVFGCALTFSLYGFLVLCAYMYNSYGSEYHTFSTPYLATDTKRSFSSYKSFESCDFIENYGYANSKSQVHCGTGAYEKSFGDPETFLNKNNFAAVERYLDNYTVWFNQRNFHSALVALNMYHNLVLSSAHNESYMVSVANSPVGNVPNEAFRSSVGITHHYHHFVLPIVVGIFIPIFSSYFILNVVAEKNGNLLAVFEVAGIAWDGFWFATFFFDFCTFLSCTFLFLMCFALVPLHEFSFTLKVVGYIGMMFYGIAILPFLYFMSYFKFETPVRAYLSMLVLQFATGIVLFIFIMLGLRAPIYIFYIALIFPIFAMIDMFYKCPFCYHIADCTSTGMLSGFNTNSVVPNIIFMCFVGLLSTFAVYLIIDYKKTAKYRTPKGIREYRSLIDLNGDPEVINVKQNIAAFTRSECLKHLVCVDQLEKKLGRSRRIHTLSFTVEPGQILCIRGPKNSAKSHLGRQLVGLADHQFGEVYINEKDLKIDLELVQSVLGYCPQYMKLYSSMSMSQHLSLFFLIKGVKTKTIKKHVRFIVNLFHAKRFCHRPVRDLTFSEKRKICVAIACVLNPKLIILDEPTVGLNLSDSREIWSVLRYLRYCGKGIIVLTNDPQECEVLGGTVLIMDNYRMLAYNNVYNMQLHYTRYLVFEAKLNLDGSYAEEIEENLKNDVNNLTEFVMFLDRGSYLLRQKYNWLQYKLPIANVLYSRLWGAVEHNQQRLNIGEYNLYIDSEDFYFDLLTNKKRKAINIQEGKDKILSQPANVN